MARAWCEIPLQGKHANGRVTLVDVDDYGVVAQHRWIAWEIPAVSSGPYAAAGSVFMHTLLTGFTQTDHQNGDGLDNRRHNLRPATNTQNQRNKRKPRMWRGKPCHSQYKGVSRYKDTGKYTATITVKRKRMHLGSFDDEVSAAQAYDREALRLFGDYARLNFPFALRHEASRVTPKPRRA